MAIDTSDLIRASLEAAKQGDELELQVRKWMVIGTWVACTASIAFVFNRSCPNETFVALLPTMAGFALALVSALASVLCASKWKLRFGEHLAHAHNRESLNQAIASRPVCFSAPRRIADEQNAPRNALIEQCQKEHARAEAAWNWSARWKVASRALTSVAVLAFAVAVLWPPLHVARGGTLVPTHCSAVNS